ncbi:MAG: cold-shock protein [Lachnospiraceae bacterium]|nr:cold-shock protein [Lachnospiraceae bacterium]MBP5184256.1 cold-shock protein [Lachnospiraceae bacterium]
MSNGTVKWFNAKSGYGFITDDEGKDVFVHFTKIKMDGFKTLNQGDKVQFEVSQGERGLQAEDVTKVD